MKQYTTRTTEDLRDLARKYNRDAALQVAKGVKPVWDQPAEWLEEVLDELTDRVGVEAVEYLRSSLADEHATLVTAYQDDYTPAADKVTV